jgi:hypothetical protein
MEPRGDAPTMADLVAALVNHHPELDADQLRDAHSAMQNDEEDRPRAYDDPERRAHQLALAYLQHRDTPDWDGAWASYRRGLVNGWSKLRD